MNTQTRTLLVSTTFLSLPLISCYANEDNQQTRQTQKPVIHKSVDIISPNDPDFNVFESKKLFNHVESGTHVTTEKNNVKSAALNSRATAHIQVHRPLVAANGLCITPENPNIFGSGQLVSYATLLTDHHVASFDDPRDTYTFGSSFDISPWNSPPSTYLDDLWLRERLYRLGFSKKFNLNKDYGDINDISFTDPQMINYIRKWSFSIDKDYYGKNFHDGKRRDLVLEVAQHKCIDEFNLWIHGPGIFFDWSEPSRPEGVPGFTHPETNDLIYGTMHNVLDNSSNLFTSVALPGIVDLTSNGTCAPAQGAEECNPINNYGGCVASTTDVLEGSSGGAGLFFPQVSTGRGLIWGNLQGLRWAQMKYNQDSWGFGSSADHPDTIPNLNRAYTTYTATTSKIVDDIEKHKNGNTRNDGTSQPPRSQSSVPLDPNDVVFINPNEVDAPGDCIGRRCSNPPSSAEIVTINCANLYQTYFPHWSNNHEGYVFSGMGVGITGVPYYQDGISTIGTLGLVCAPWSTFPYTETWEYVGHDTVRGNFAQAWTHRPPIKIKPFPFSYELTRNSITKKEGNDEFAKTFPFQMCAPGYLLKGIKMRMLPENVGTLEQFTLLGVSEIRCEKNYELMPGDEIVDVPLEPNFNNALPDHMKIETLIGDVKASDDSFGDGQWLLCEQGKHISGFLIDIKSNSGPPAYLKLSCTSNPPRLEMNLCDRSNILALPGAPLLTFNPPQPSCSTPALFSPPSNNADNCP